jgi:hypothetical protein
MTTLKNFRKTYESKVKKVSDGMQPTFDIRKALADAENIANRKSVIFTK